jgi:hypothetical protein
MGPVVMRLRTTSKELFVGVCAVVQAEGTVGGPISGSPGQPVETGALRASYIPEFIDAHTFEISSNLEYAEPIENGVGPHGPLILRSSVGGFHSWKTVRAGFPRIVEHVAGEVGGA